MNTKSANFKKWFTFVILVLGAGTIYKIASLKSAFYVPMQEFMGLTHTQIGTATGVWSTIASFGFIFSVYISDRFSKKIMLPLALILTGLLGFWLATFPSFGVVLFIYAMFGVTCDMLYWPILLKSIKSLGTDEEQGRLFGFLEGGRGAVDTIVAFIGLGIFAMLGSNAFGLQASIWFFSGAMIVIGIISYFCLEHDKKVEVEKTEKKKSSFDTVKVVIKMPEVWMVSFTIFFVYAMYCGLVYFLPFLEEVYALPVALVGAYGIINQYGLKILSGPVGGVLADKKFKSPSKFLRFSFVVGVIILGVFTFLPHEAMGVYTGMILTLVVGTIIFAMRSVFFAPMGEIKIAEEMSGAAMSIGSFIGYAPGIFCYTLYGSILDKNPGLAGFRIVFLIMCGFGVAGFIVSNILVKKIKKDK
ncbi:MAG: MFS transporter [Clostridium sp.]|nr:MFS transporter [Clostridium sp.]MDU7083187.1 MFS transporter [Clostridium sp.]